MCSLASLSLNIIGIHLRIRIKFTEFVINPIFFFKWCIILLTIFGTRSTFFEDLINSIIGSGGFGIPPCSRKSKPYLSLTTKVALLCISRQNIKLQLPNTIVLKEILTQILISTFSKSSQQSKNEQVYV